MTLKPTKTLLCSAALKAFNVSNDEADRFAIQINSFRQHSRSKLKSMSSGKKLVPAVRTICRALLKLASGSSPEPSPRSGTRRRLKKTSSYSSCGSTPVKKKNRAPLREVSTAPILSSFPSSTPGRLSRASAPAVDLELQKRRR